MKISSIILAAGNSSRFIDSNKLLKKINGISIIQSVANTVLKAKFTPIIVVTGFESEMICKNLSGLDVNCIKNQNWSNGLSSSLKSGILKIKEEINGALISLGDMPLISKETLLKMKRKFLSYNGNFIICPEYKNKLGNPIIMPKKFFNSVHDLIGDEGFKKIIQSNPDMVKTLKINSNEIFKDIDTQNDLINYE